MARDGGRPRWSGSVDRRGPNRRAVVGGRPTPSGRLGRCRRPSRIDRHARHVRRPRLAPGGGRGGHHIRGPPGRQGGGRWRPGDGPPLPVRGRKPGGTEAIYNAPEFVAFRTQPEEVRRSHLVTDLAAEEYLLFLRRRTDGRYQFVSGQLDPGLSIRTAPPAAGK